MNTIPKQEFDKALRQMEIYPTVIVTKTGEYPVGNFAIFDKEAQMVHSTIKRRTAFIQNGDLFNLIWIYEGTKCIKLYISKGGETYGFDGVFPEKFSTELPIKHRLGFNIMNSYSGRFLPTITFSLIDMESEIIVRTSLNMFEPFTKKNFDQDKQWQISSEILTNTLFLTLNTEIAYSALRDYFPAHIHPYFDKYAPLYIEKHNNTSWGALKLTALLVKQWSKTSYESAVAMQKKLYTVITELQNERIRQTASHTF